MDDLGGGDEEKIRTTDDVESARLITARRNLSTSSSPKDETFEVQEEEVRSGATARGTKRYNLWMHSLAFMILFSAFQTASEYAQPIMLELGHGNLGFESTAVIYFSLSFSNVVAPIVVSSLGTVRSMITGSGLYLAYLAAFAFVPTRWTILSTSALLGFGAAVLWTAQGSFLVANTTLRSRGRDSGIFWALLQMRLLVGNAFAAHAMYGKTEIETDTARTFFFEMLCIGGLGFAMFWLLKAERARVRVTPPSVSDTLDLMKKLVSEPVMKLLCVLSAYSGLILSFWSGKYFTVISGHNESDGDALTLPGSFTPGAVAIAGMFVAFGEIAGGILYGRVADKYGRRIVASASGICHAIAIVVVNLVVYYGQRLDDDASLRLMLLAGFLLGFGDSGVSTLMYGLVGEKYPGRNESTPAFAIVKFAQSLAASIAFMYAGAIPMSAQCALLLISLSLGVASVYALECNRAKRSTRRVALSSK